MDIETLIRRLSNDVDPVRRLRPPWVRTLFWFAISAPWVAVISVWLAYGRKQFEDITLLIEQVAPLATSLSAAWAALALTVPGNSRRLVLLPLTFLVIWFFVAAGWGSVPTLLHTEISQSYCSYLLSAYLMGALPFVAMILMLRRGAPIAPRLTVAFGILAAMALANTGFRLAYGPAGVEFATIIVFGVIFFTMAVGFMIGHRLLCWRHQTGSNTGNG